MKCGACTCFKQLFQPAATVSAVRATEKLFGITRRPVAQLTQEDIDCLYRELRVTKESHNVRVVFVKGTDDMSRFAVEKIFAEYHPCRVEVVDETSCLVSFASRADCVRMMIGMTKPLRRFRATRAAEDGELTDSDGEEEEGQIKLEKGDDVAWLVKLVKLGEQLRKAVA
ncbi:hypothetical protein OSTOST_07697 [Ostertagia ostertagi]